MSLYEENNLPGIITEVVTEYGEDYDTSQFGVGDSVAILGTAFSGPPGRYTEVYSPAHASYIYGPSFDPKTRKEATLVAAIQDAWDRGCRTIYAVRIGGKDIYKDFQLKTGTKFKLRVSGLFPSNANKDLAMSYEKEGDNGIIKIYKKADRATIKEKRLGLVDKADQMLCNDISLDMFGLSEDDELVDLVKNVNSNQFNNVIRLSIVDEDGNDVTLSSREAKALKVKDLFEGIYLIGRSINAEGVTADTKLSLKAVDGVLSKELVKNTNVNKDIPLFSKDGKLDEILGVPSENKYGFLSVPGKLDDLFIKDNIDYEEVDMSLFDAYEKLGSGYAINSEIVKVVSADGTVKEKVVEVKDKDRKVSPIKSGILSVLENLKVDYRVLAGFNADDKIRGRLPKKEDFKVSKANEIVVDSSCLNIVPVVEKDDTSAPKAYSLTIRNIEEEEAELLKSASESVHTHIVARECSVLSEDAIAKLRSTSKIHKASLKEGSLFLEEINPDSVEPSVHTAEEDKLYLLNSYTNGSVQLLHTPYDATNDKEKDVLAGEIVYSKGKLYKASHVARLSDGKAVCFFKLVTKKSEVFSEMEASGNMLISLDRDVFVVANVKANMDEIEKISILGTCNQVFASTSDDLMLTEIETAYSNEGVLGESDEITESNKIVIKTNQYDFITVDELATFLQEDEDFSRLFKVVVTSESNAQKYLEEMIEEAKEELEEESDEISVTYKPLYDKKVGYDYAKLIRFRTTDNFARLLAQHCAYASLKTAPTHGIIGVSPLLNTSMESIDKKVQSLIAMGLDKTIVAKKDNGQNMLNKDSAPYNIGKNVSVVVCQYPVTTSSNYTYISNMAPGYAGMVSRLPVDQSSTCQPISIPQPTVSFNVYQLKNLTNAGFVTVKESQTMGRVVTDGVTMAPAQDIFRRLSCTRVANAVDEILRAAGEPFIGQQNTPANQNSLRTALKSGLESVKGQLIEGYEFVIDIDNQNKQLGKITVYYTIVPIYEIKEIKNHVTM